MNEYDRQFRENPQPKVRGGKAMNHSTGYKSKRQIDRERKRAGKPTFDEAQRKFLDVFMGAEQDEEPG